MAHRPQNVVSGGDRNRCAVSAAPRTQESQERIMYPLPDNYAPPVPPGVTASGYSDGSREAGSGPYLSDLISDLINTVAEAHARVEQLEKRLFPVLRFPSPPQEDPGKLSASLPQALESLRSVVIGAQQLNYHLMDIEKRIAL